MVITKIDDKTINELVPLAKKLYALKKGETVRLELIIPMQRGRFVRLRQAAVEVEVR